MLLIIVNDMRKRAWEAMPAITPASEEATTPPPPQAD